MTLTKLSLFLYKLFPPKESLVSDIPAGDGNNEKIFYGAESKEIKTVSKFSLLNRNPPRQNVHCKKRLMIFPSLASRDVEILVSDIPAGEGKIVNFFTVYNIVGFEHVVVASTIFFSPF